MNHDIITMDHGSGGGATSRLIEELLVPAFHNPQLSALGDGALLELSGPLVFSTDSFVIDPVFFPGGDIGKLAVCGTVNDVAMCGGTPRYLSLGFILEEGFPLESLRRIVSSIADTAADCGVSIVTGDTKVVEKGRGDGIYINTSGIGTLTWPGLSPANLKPGDKVILSGTMGDHGTAVMLARSGLLEGGDLRSDCQPLCRLAASVLEAGGVRVLRDPTRGGVATTLNEFVDGTNLSIELEEDTLPVRPAVHSACEMLGLDPLYCANEGKMLAVVDPQQAEAALAALRSTPGGEDAAIIGTVTDRYPGKVILNTCLGGGRVLTRLTGAQLPRIC
ncbi:MAG: hydrogenase expression/formation protein HypE [Ruminococcaceae bacterium]|nr:hydrogenase expression/formation protein HypE [Oscillospiraceae bacterium]